MMVRNSIRIKNRGLLVDMVKDVSQNSITGSEKSDNTYEPRPTQLPAKRPYWMRPSSLGFITIFAAIGCYFLFKSFAAITPITTLESEQMALPDSAAIVSDSAASAGKAVALYKSGIAAGSVNFSSEVTSMAVTARGDQCAGPPIMNVTIDSVAVLSGKPVSSASWGNYTGRLKRPIPAGVHMVSITYTNDYQNIANTSKSLACNRNLFTDAVSFFGPKTNDTALVPSATMTLSPSSATVALGSTVQLAVALQAGTNHITGAQACLTYDATQLTLVNVDTTSASLTYPIPSSSEDCSPDEARISLFDITAPNGTLSLGTVTFTAKSSTDIASIGIDESKSFVKDNATADTSGNYLNIYKGSNSALITFKPAQ